MKPKVVPGDRFGRLLVLRKQESKDNSANKWVCLCDCGKEKLVIAGSLAHGLTKSCGCLNHEVRLLHRKNPGDAGYGILYSQYRHNAKRRTLKREFDLSLEEFITLVKGNCHYCGAAPKPWNFYLAKKGNSNKNRRKYSEDWIKRSEILKNGIDRLDNEKGYSFENCVPACSRCNSQKSDLSEKDFLEHIVKIFNFRNLQKGN